MDIKSKGKVKIPHLSWSGPVPHSDVEAYALAMVVRIADTDQKCRIKRTMEVAPSVLTITNLPLVARLYAYYTSHIRDEGIRTNEKLLAFMIASARDDVWAWARDNKKLVMQAEAELLEFVETEGHPGFRTYG